MITLPDFEKAFNYENNFYLSCDITRISKILAHYELFKLVSQIPGAIVECGVLKGASFSRFAMFREIFANPYSKKIIGFYTFGEFPETSFNDDKKPREKQITNAGGESISKEQLYDVLKHKHVDKNIELIEDAAECLGSTVKGIKVGSQSDSAIFSFCGNKVLTTGEGGAVVTNSKKI